VLVDKHTCIGCRYCMMACPYKARSFIHEDLSDQRPHSPRGKGTVESCNFCVHRVDSGKLPACVQACSDGGHQALVFGDLNDSESMVSKRLATMQTTQVRDDLGLNTAVRYHGI
jgi:tetrathionate reductase subunit B